jgi:hypothetical protein
MTPIGPEWPLGVFVMHALFAFVFSSRTTRALKALGREINALLDAVTSPGSFVKEVESLRKK